ncbi:MAG: AI-2E family transporter [Fimbriimonadaceae bacterium]|nr:MAG: AI-2E family transporter [Fimbriimonadaceae bacterium]
MDEFRAKNSLIIFWLFTIVVTIASVFIVWPFLPAILWATVFSILLYPRFTKMVEAGWNRSLAALTVTLVPAFVVILPLAVLGSIAGVQVVSYAQELVATSRTSADHSILRAIGTELDKAAQPVLQQLGVTNVNLVDLIEKNESQLAKGISGPLVKGLQSFIVTVVTLIIALLTTFFMVRDCHNMSEVILDLIPLKREQTRAILERVATTVRSVFFAVVVVAGIQGAIAGLVYWIAGVPGTVALMLITTLFCTIPMLGAPVIYVPIGLSLLFQGKIWQGITVLAVGFIVISNIDNVLRPFFIGANTKLHPIPIFFALLGGVLVMGPVGLMAGPMLLTVILAVIDVLRLQPESEETTEEPQPA